jgi:hypothetical protein
MTFGLSGELKKHLSSVATIGKTRISVGRRGRTISVIGSTPPDPLREAVVTSVECTARAGGEDRR